MQCPSSFSRSSSFLPVDPTSDHCGGSDQDLTVQSFPWTPPLHSYRVPLIGLPKKIAQVQIEHTTVCQCQAPALHRSAIRKLNVAQFLTTNYESQDPHQRVLIGAETNVGRRDTDVSNEPDRLGYEIVESTMKKSRFVEPPSKSALTEHLQSRSRWFHGSAEFRRFHNPARCELPLGCILIFKAPALRLPLKAQACSPCPNVGYISGTNGHNGKNISMLKIHKQQERKGGLFPQDTC
ncbi:hypothetical protein PGT21_006826 [Puccinia graminis f. sp. tritici]|uniref:Uncharacterized protein n=1 Tax=Puccinia graminis f. sp. tritici TaxID=56615 RepID=A0A5B0NBN0_PUCGR|nr:hypothetical protein PGT21_006826 [Puccinia graminis f. sp. tritici]